MITQKHKQVFFVSLVSLALAITFGMMFIFVNVNLLENKSITADQFTTYRISKAFVSTDKAPEQGLLSKNLSLEFVEAGASESERVRNNGLREVGNTIKSMNNKEPAIYNIHAVSDWKSGSAEFIFESSSPADYESNLFQQSYSPFTRLTNQDDMFSDISFKSLVTATGERTVIIDAKSDTTNLTSGIAQIQWNQIIGTLAVVPNTSYQVKLETAMGVNIYSNFSTQDEITALNNFSGNVWTSAFLMVSNDESMTGMGVTGLDMYLSPNKSNRSTIAVTVKDPENKASYIEKFSKIKEKNPNIELPTNLVTTTLTAVDGKTPFHVFYPSKNVM